MNRVSVDTDNIERVERGICPPLGMAITLPVLVNGEHTRGVAIYIAASPFDPHITLEAFKDIAAEIAWRINRTVP